MQLLSASLPGRAVTSLPGKVALFVFLAIAVRGAVVGWELLHHSRGFFRQVVERSLPQAVDRSAARLDAWLAAGQTEVELAATDRGAQQHAVELARATPLTRPAREALERALAPTLARSRSLEGLWVVDGKGRVRFARGRRPASESLPADVLRAGLHSLAADREPPVPLAVAPLRDARGRRAGWLVARFSARALEEALPGDSLPGVGRGYVTDAEGRVLFGALDEEALPEWIPLADRRAPPVEYRSAAGAPRLAAARPLAQLGWHVAAVAHLDEGFEPIMPLIWHVFLVDGLVILVVAWLAYRLTARIVRPVEALWDGARRIAEGDLEVEIPESPGGDEIGQLTRTFNAMAHKLREDQTEIEAFNRTLRDRNQALQAANEVLAQLSITDGLTKLHNHRFFQEHLTRELKRVARTGEPLAMLLIDIDDFKALNDRYGHATGDAVLVRIGEIMNATVRESDLLARYGGEEFVVLAETDLEGALKLAEKLRMAVMEAPLVADESMRLTHVTISIGIARYKGDRKAFFRDADRALYSAKASGKNCVVIDPEDV